MERFFDIAGNVVRVTAPDSDMFLDDGILTPFAIAEAAWDWDVSLRVVDTLTPPRGSCVFSDPGRMVYRDGGQFISYIGSVGITLDGAYIRAERSQGRTDVEIRRSALRGRITPRVLLTALEAEHLIVSTGGFLLHASCICHNGEAILFTAASGTGKSTQASLWQQLRGAEIINGDRCVVKRGENGFEACGIPFSGSSGICKSRRMPLRAIVCLDQAPKTTIARLNALRAFRLIWAGCSYHTWNSDDISRCSDTVMEAVSRIPIFYLACTPDESAVIALEQALESR